MDSELKTKNIMEMTNVGINLNDDSWIELTEDSTASALKIVVKFRTSDTNDEISRFQSSSMPVVSTGMGSV